MEPLGFPFNFVILIILITTIGGVARTWAKHHGKLQQTKADPKLEAENKELRGEIETMRERLHVLERITVDKENSLAREIEDLRTK